MPLNLNPIAALLENLNPVSAAIRSPEIKKQQPEKRPESTEKRERKGDQ